MEKEVIAYLDNGMIIDSQSVKNTNLKEIYFDNSKESLEVIRHSCAHLMAQAIKSLYPEAKFFVGPVIEDGFYYDFRVASKISEEDLAKIEKKMKELAEAKIEISKYAPATRVSLKKRKNFVLGA